MNRSFFVKIAALIISFGAVIYGIKTLKSPEFSNQMETSDAMALLTGGDLKPMNWCLHDTVKIESYSAEGQILKSFSEKSEIAAFCELMIGGFNSEGVDPASYKKLLVARDAAGKERVLESIPGQEIYRVEGMPFKTSMIKKALERLEAK